ncbi:LTA synthase family protein [Methylobacterium organophilum]|uniref:Sulfatase N-terminal domain-containing protein n=1 Tax=Methylobacterium organophilum TaxID=410 RepID=A0ABQ4TC05_METOR|nr:LTA synthase family protein [Methylobacterium organophilum]GJE28174.1 hypothetical protein LKMONMHP_3041 [Methylobacterium organophilum]
MPDLLTSVFAPLLVALLGSFAIEAAASPVAVGRRPRDLAVRLAAYALVMAFWFTFSWRPWLAATSCLLTVAGFEAVSALKRKVIGEPLAFSDFALLKQVPRYPELYYVPPVSDPRVALPALGGIGLVILWYVLEPAQLPRATGAALAALLLWPLALAGLLALARSPWGRSRLARLFPRPALAADVARYGHPATLLGYALRRDAERAAGPAPRMPPAAPAAGPEVIVVVQLESFLDPERLGGPALPLMRRIREQAESYGRLRVPAHGAYTMRTEHAVLTGLRPEELGFGVFDPYLSGGGSEPESLARLARAAGYETVFVHPFDADFFERRRIFAQLGFDRIVDRDAFAQADRVGPYIGDAAVAARLLAEVRGRTRPLFLFCVTMENHGPWPPGRLPGFADPLAQWLHHAANSGRAAETLIDGLAGVPALLCLYGDHAPSLPNCRPGFGDTCTDYALFRFDGGGGSPTRRDLTADGLGRLLRGHVTGAGAGKRDESLALSRS